MAEVILPQRSDYAGRTLAVSQLAEKFDIQVITLRRGDKVLPRKDTQLRFGDALLVRGKWSAIERLHRETRNFVVVGEPDALSKQVVQLTPRSYIALATLLGMIGLMVFDIVPTVMAVLLAAVVMILTGCLSLESGYRSINWQTVVLIAATLPLSTAMRGHRRRCADRQHTGQHAGRGRAVGLDGRRIPVNGQPQPGHEQHGHHRAGGAHRVAGGAQAGCRAGADDDDGGSRGAAAFLTPIASPTNTLVFEAGGYSWGDYAKVGLPLIVLVMPASLYRARWPGRCKRSQDSQLGGSDRSDPEQVQESGVYVRGLRSGRKSHAHDQGDHGCDIRRLAAMGSTLLAAETAAV